MLFAASDDGDGASGAFATYAVANNNPASWAEGYDSGNDAHTFAMGYAAYSPLSGTGNASVTYNDLPQSRGVIFIINLPSAPVSVISGAFALLAPTVGVSNTPIASAFTLLAPTTPALNSISDAAKSASEWTNPDKS